MRALKCAFCGWINPQEVNAKEASAFPAVCRHCACRLDRRNEVIDIPSVDSTAESPPPPSDPDAVAAVIERLADVIESGVTVNLNVNSSEDFMIAVRTEGPAPAAKHTVSHRATAVWFTVAALVLAALFPPWYQSRLSGLRVPMGYAPVWNPPQPQSDSAMLIDFGRLVPGMGSCRSSLWCDAPHPATDSSLCFGSPEIACRYWWDGLAPCCCRASTASGGLPAVCVRLQGGRARPRMAGIRSRYRG
jgi:hypothetical protein